MSTNRLASIFKPQHSAAEPCLCISESINESLKTFLLVQTEKPQNVLGNNKITCLLQVLISGKWAEAYDHNHCNPLTGTVDLHPNLRMNCKPDNNTDPLTHHRPQWHRHQCRSWSLQWLSKTVTPTAHQQEMKTAASACQSTSLPCHYTSWGVGPHMLDTNTQWPLPKIVWIQGDLDSSQGTEWVTYTWCDAVLSTEIFIFYDVSHPSSLSRRPPKLYRVRGLTQT